MLELVKHLSDDELASLNRGGHDPLKVYAAFKAAVDNKAAPTVILAKTIKGYGLGGNVQGKNITHQRKKLTTEDLVQFRDKFNIPISEKDVSKLSFIKPSKNSEVFKYLQQRREILGGPLPARTEKFPEISFDDEFV